MWESMSGREEGIGCWGGLRLRRLRLLLHRWKWRERKGKFLTGSLQASKTKEEEEKHFRCEKKKIMSACKSWRKKIEHVVCLKNEKMSYFLRLALQNTPKRVSFSSSCRRLITNARHSSDGASKEKCSITKKKASFFWEEGRQKHFPISPPPPPPPPTFNA